MNKKVLNFFRKLFGVNQDVSALPKPPDGRIIKKNKNFYKKR